VIADRRDEPIVEIIAHPDRADERW
jgi:hypothetical protein